MTEGLAWLGYPILNPNGNERALWEVGDDQPVVTYKLFSSSFSGFYSIMASGQLMLTFNDFSVNPRQSWPCFSWGLKNVNLSCLTCHLFKSDLSVLSLFKNLTSPPLQKEKNNKGEKSETPFNALQRGLWRQRLKWGVMQNTSPHCFWMPSPLCFVLF